MSEPAVYDWTIWLLLPEGDADTGTPPRTALPTLRLIGATEGDALAAFEHFAGGEHNPHALQRGEEPPPGYVGG